MKILASACPRRYYRPAQQPAEQLAMNDPIVAYRVFTDGTTRPVYEDWHGKQYVVDEDGNRVYGVWFIPESDTVDLPIIVRIAEK
jgi:hypothetical protein